MIFSEEVYPITQGQSALCVVGVPGLISLKALLTDRWPGLDVLSGHPVE